jgi:hypothetical protein
MLKKLNNLSAILSKLGYVQASHEIRIILKMCEDKDSEESEDELGDDCYPKNYAPGKKYGRDILAKIFCCMTNNEWPYIVVRETYFPFLPGKVDWSEDPKRIPVGPNEYIDMKEFVNREKSKVSKWELRKIKISPDLIHKDTLNFISGKKAAPGYEKRVEYQKNKIRELKGNTVELTRDEPLMIEVHDGKYKVQEGWHRFLAILEMVESGELKDPVVMAGVATPK